MKLFTTEKIWARTSMTLFAMLMSLGMWAQETCEPGEHVWGEWQEWPATCTYDGYYYRECTKCDEWEIGEYIPAFGVEHDFSVYKVTEAPSCTQDGYAYYACSRCGELDYDNEMIIPSPGHQWGEDYKEVTSPTCTSNGYAYPVCENCGNYNYEDGKTIPPLGHLWGDGSVTQAPTCYDNGWQTRTCDRCGATGTSYIPALGHDFDEKGVCSRCGSEPGKLKLTNMGNNYASILERDGQTVEATLLDRTLKAGHWNTLSLPFDMSAEQIANSPLKNAVIRTISGCTNDGTTLTITFSDVPDMSANYPYLVWFEGEDIVNPVFEDVTVTCYDGVCLWVEGVLFIGTSNKSQVLAANDRYHLFLSNDNLYYPTADVTVGNCRAYFELEEEAPVGADAKIFIDFGDGELTEIAAVDSEEKDGAWYTLSGVKLDGKPTENGVYIVNGKKIVIK